MKAVPANPSTDENSKGADDFLRNRSTREPNKNIVNGINEIWLAVGNLLDSTMASSTVKILSRVVTVISRIANIYKINADSPYNLCGCNVRNKNKNGN